MGFSFRLFFFRFAPGLWAPGCVYPTQVHNMEPARECSNSRGRFFWFFSNRVLGGLRGPRNPVSCLVLFALSFFSRTLQLNLSTVKVYSYSTRPKFILRVPPPAFGHLVPFREWGTLILLTYSIFYSAHRDCCPLRSSLIFLITQFVGL